MFKRVAVAALAVSLLGVALPEEAQAVTRVDVSAGDLTVRYDDCGKTTVTAKGNWANDFRNEIRIVVSTPAGRRFDSRTVRNEFSGRVDKSVSLCWFDREGRYRVSVMAVGFDDSGDVTSRERGHTSFRYRHVDKSSSRINRRVQWTGGGQYPYSVPAQLLRRGRGMAAERVNLQVRISGYWYRVGRMRTNQRGYFGWMFKPNGRTWRYVFHGDSTTYSAYSNTFKTPRRHRSVAGVGAASDEPSELRSLVRPR